MMVGKDNKGFLYFSCVQVIVYGGTLLFGVWIFHWQQRQFLNNYNFRTTESYEIKRLGSNCAYFLHMMNWKVVNQNNSFLEFIQG